MVALLRDALKPNLVQTAEGGPAFVHAGPFGNVAHGCSSVLATRLALRLGDYAITEGGFGFDLGGEKFLDIKCRLANLFPRAVVLVATLRALKMHGGAPVHEASAPGIEALRRGLAHLEKHVESVRAFGLPPVVAINVFPQDTAEEIALVMAEGERLGVRVGKSEGFVRGGEGALDLASVVSEVVDATDAAPPAPRFLYALSESPEAKIRAIARAAYGARDAELSASAQRDLKRIGDLGASLPICMAKTQASLTDDPARFGRPRDFVVTVREVRLNAGAGFLIALTGEMLTMPGLPRVPAARNIHLLASGRIRGLMQGD
jgi:formate--tetrahydrofolate ligase